MKKLFICVVPILSFCACSYVSVKEPSSSMKSDNKTDLTEEQQFIKDAASLQHIDYATVLKDTAYIGIPSRRGEEHAQDKIADIFLSDLRKSGKFTQIKCCKIINTAKDFTWNDSVVSGNQIGVAFAEE